MDGKKEDLQPEIFASIACKAAIKAGDRVNASEVKALLTDLSGLRNPYQCPHGRPVFFRMSRHELEKRFKRIV
jgi:DNA mismatch repair protein MutL